MIIVMRPMATSDLKPMILYDGLGLDFQQGNYLAK